MELQERPVRRPATNEALQRLVESRTCGHVRELRVEIAGDDVVIFGHADNYYTKQLATHAVLESVGGLHLTNNIEVN